MFTLQLWVRITPVFAFATLWNLQKSSQHFKSLPNHSLCRPCIPSIVLSLVVLNSICHPYTFSIHIPSFMISTTNNPTLPPISSPLFPTHSSLQLPNSPFLSHVSSTNNSPPSSNIACKPSHPSPNNHHTNPRISPLPTLT